MPPVWRRCGVVGDRSPLEEESGGVAMKGGSPLDEARDLQRAAPTVNEARGLPVRPSPPLDCARGTSPCKQGEQRLTGRWRRGKICGGIP